MFDPPWLISGPVNKANKMRLAYGGFDTASQMFGFQDKALQKISRILIPGGHLVTKVQDCSHGRQKYFLSVYQVNKARELGLDLVDSLILISGNKLRHPTAGRISTISAHCFFNVFRRASRRKRIIRY